MEYYTELRETVEKLEGLLEGAQSQKGVHEGDEWLERRANWYMLWLALKQFKREEL